MGGHHLVWVLHALGTWEGTPPGRWRVAEVIHRTKYVDSLTYKPLIREWWILVFCGEEIEEEFSDPETAMRSADNLWDQRAAQRRLWRP